MKKHISLSTAMLMIFSLVSCSSSASRSVNESAPFSANEESTDMADENTITMAIAGSPADTLVKAIEDLNSADNGFKIELRSFLDNYDENGLPIEFTNDDVNQIDFQVIQEIINTDNLDIVGSFSFINRSNYYILIEKWETLYYTTIL